MGQINLYTAVEEMKAVSKAEGTFSITATLVCGQHVGNIFCEFTDETDLNEDELHKVLHEAAVNIQYILPEFKENKIE